MSKPGETILKQYLESKGLTVIKIPESDIKTVDFEVHAQGKLAFYLEEKTLEITPVAWKSIDPVYNAIAKHIKEAVKQFKSVNPDKTVPNVLAITNMDLNRNVNHLFSTLTGVPNVLAITNMDPNRNVNHLFSTLTGQVITATGKLRWINKLKSIEDDLSLIDLYLWFDNDQLSVHIYEGDNLEHQDKLTTLLGLMD